MWQFIAGAVVTGTITYIVAVLPERRREKRAVRAALRLVAADLRRILSTLETTVDQGQIFGPETSRALHDTILPVARWHQHAALLAESASVGDEAFTDFSDAFMMAEMLRVFLAKPGDRDPDALLAFIASAYRFVRAALIHLGDDDDVGASTARSRVEAVYRGTHAASM
jgi:hypothetical protein